MRLDDDEHGFGCVFRDLPGETVASVFGGLADGQLGSVTQVLPPQGDPGTGQRVTVVPPDRAVNLVSVAVIHVLIYALVHRAPPEMVGAVIADAITEGSVRLVIHLGQSVPWAVRRSPPWCRPPERGGMGHD